MALSDYQQQPQLARTGYKRSSRRRSSPGSLSASPSSLSSSPVVVAGGSSGLMASSQRRLEAFRLMQGLVIAYENMSLEQRHRAVLRNQSFLAALVPLLEVRSCSHEKIHLLGRELLTSPFSFVLIYLPPPSCRRLRCFRWRVTALTGKGRLTNRCLKATPRLSAMHLRPPRRATTESQSWFLSMMILHSVAVPFRREGKVVPTPPQGPDDSAWARGCSVLSGSLYCQLFSTPPTFILKFLSSCYILVWAEAEGEF